MKIEWKKYSIYHLRWQLGSLIIGPILWVLLEYYKIPYIGSMIILNVLGAIIFFPIDMWIARIKERMAAKNGILLIDGLYDAADEHEKYHQNGMTDKDGIMNDIPAKEASMYCANSFVDGANWYKEQLNKQ